MTTDNTTQKTAIDYANEILTKMDTVGIGGKVVEYNGAWEITFIENPRKASTKKFDILYLMAMKEKHPEAFEVLKGIVMAVEVLSNEGDE